jgi:hypothetical protein
MNYQYDLFEKFPDGSSLWRACVKGLRGARLHMLHLAGHSQNKFYAMNVKSGKVVYFDHGHDVFGADAKFEKRGRSAAA